MSEHSDLNVAQNLLQKLSYWRGNLSPPIFSLEEYALYCDIVNTFVQWYGPVGPNPSYSQHVNNLLADTSGPSTRVSTTEIPNVCLPWYTATDNEGSTADIPPALSSGQYLPIDTSVPTIGKSDNDLTDMPEASLTGANLYPMDTASVVIEAGQFGLPNKQTPKTQKRQSSLIPQDVSDGLVGDSLVEGAQIEEAGTSQLTSPFVDGLASDRQIRKAITAEKKARLKAQQAVKKPNRKRKAQIDEESGTPGNKKRKIESM